MTLFGKNYALGLDIGQTTVKAVLLSRSGRAVRVQDKGTLDLRAEGIIDEHELYRELRPWVDNQGWQKYDIIASIPQYVATTQITDFPPGSDKNLDEMVSFETQQLAGLSEDSFLHDYQPLPPKFGRRNPVLIGICRESVIEERATSLREAGVPLTDFTISSTALAAAYLHLHPESGTQETPQLVLDIGAENTTAAILAGGDLLYTASLMCGADRYNQIVAQELGISVEKVEEQDKQYRINPADRDSPPVTAARIFEREILNTIEQWRSDERPEIGRIQFSKVCICGGGAAINGIDKYLGALLECPAEIIGVPLAEEDRDDPRLVTAYGLALQGIGASAVTISLAPPTMKQWVHRRRRFPCLATAIAAAILVVALLQTRYYLYLTTRESKLDAIEAKLKRSNKIIPKLEEIDLQTQMYERILTPYAETCNHTRQLQLTINELGRARNQLAKDSTNARPKRDKGGWVIYIADEKSYHAGKQNYSGESSESGSSSTQPRSPFATSGGERSREKEITDATAETVTIAVSDLHNWKSFVAAIYAAQPADHPLSRVRAFTDALNSSEMFENSKEDRVDTFQDKDIRGREDIFRPWLDSPVNLNNYRRAVIRLPLSDQYQAVNSIPKDKQEQPNE